jgi:3-hydroxyisobutyrate dehydrogenase
MERSMSSNPAVAVLGTGIMGAPMARNLLAAGFPLRVWNRSSEKAEPLAADGAVVADSPREASDGAEIVLTMLADADAVLDTVADALDGTQVWVQASTIGVEGTERCAALAGEHGVAFVDAPVLGTKQPAEQGQLIVLASGPADQRERLAPLFDAIGARTFWLGDAGAGTRLKLVANAWVLSLVEGLAETLVLAEGLGVAPELFLETIAGGPLDCGYAQLKGKAMIERDFPASFPLSLALKDARLVRKAAERAGVELPLVETVERQFERADDDGHGDEDMAAVFLATAR